MTEERLRTAFEIREDANCAAYEPLVPGYSEHREQRWSNSKQWLKVLPPLGEVTHARIENYTDRSFGYIIVLETAFGESIRLSVRPTEVVIHIGSDLHGQKNIPLQIPVQSANAEKPLTDTERQEERQKQKE